MKNLSVEEERYEKSFNAKERYKEKKLKQLKTEY